MLLKWFLILNKLRKDSDSLLIVDIDHTLATPKKGTSLPINYLLRFGYYNCMCVLSGTKEYILKYDNVVFLSARNILYYNCTHKWLSINVLGKRRYNLFLVSSAKAKIQFLKLANKLFSKIIFIDDMSFNHENGNVLFYNDIINEISKIKNVTYLDYSFISKLNKK